MQRLGYIGLLVLAALLVQIVYAEPTAPPVLSDISSERRDLTALPTQTIDAQGGNLTQVNIEMLTVSRSWQGYYGNITGEITLDNANNDTFYNWSIASSSGEVYATRNATITWTGVSCANSTIRALEETALGQSASDADSVTNTFNTTDHPELIVGLVNITTDTCYSTNAFVNGNQDTSRFHQILLVDGSASNNIVYTTIIDTDQTGFDGSTYDFQLLVGEDEHDGQEGPTTYYIWVELG